MEQYKIERINQLAKASKERQLTEEEKKEQAALRAEYIEGYRKNLEAQLENIKIIDDYGNKKSLRKKEDNKNEN